jgi:hypothetical protein
VFASEAFDSAAVKSHTSSKGRFQFFRCNGSAFQHSKNVGEPQAHKFYVTVARRFNMNSRLFSSVLKSCNGGVFISWLGGEPSTLVQPEEKSLRSACCPPRSGGLFFCRRGDLAMETEYSILLPSGGAVLSSERQSYQWAVGRACGAGSSL